MATQNSEDYLRCIFKLQTGDTGVPTSSIAAAMGVTQPSVTDMIQRLSGEGYLQYKRYGGVRLTKEGMKIAKKLLINRDGKKYMELDITEVKFLDKVDDSEFKQP